MSGSNGWWQFAERERYCAGSDILYREDVATLLARQHAAVVRMVKNMLKEVAHVKDAAHFVRGERHAYQQVLAALKTKKGRR